MDLTRTTLPGAVGDLHYGIGLMTGWDRIFAVLLPAEYVRCRAGRKILRAFADAAPEKRITFTMPGDPRVWEVRRDGAVVSWRGGG
jgi:hypothetical protein